MTQAQDLEPKAASSRESVLTENTTPTQVLRSRLLLRPTSGNVL